MQLFAKSVAVLNLLFEGFRNRSRESVQGLRLRMLGSGSWDVVRRTYEPNFGIQEMKLRV